jgi:hypothetical protein
MLFDLEVDPGEQHNLFTAQPAVVARLSDLLQRYIQEGRSTPGQKQPNDVAVRSPFKPAPTK